MIAVAGIMWRPPRGAGLATGIGGTWAGLMLRVNISCGAFDAVPGQGCESPGIEAWIGIGVVILTIGVLATLVVALRGRTPTA